jgi:hypothetical protein
LIFKRFLIIPSLVSKEAIFCSSYVATFLKLKRSKALR